MRITALSAGSRTSPEVDLERLILWCLDRFHGRVSPGQGAAICSTEDSCSGVWTPCLCLRSAIASISKMINRQIGFQMWNGSLHQRDLFHPPDKVRVRVSPNPNPNLDGSLVNPHEWVRPAKGPTHMQCLLTFTKAATMCFEPSNVWQLWMWMTRLNEKYAKARAWYDAKRGTGDTITKCKDLKLFPCKSRYSYYIRSFFFTIIWTLVRPGDNEGKIVHSEIEIWPKEVSLWEI